VGQTGYPCVAHVAVSCWVKFFERSGWFGFPAGREMLIQPLLQKFWCFSNIPPIQAPPFPGRSFRYGSEGFFAMACTFGRGDRPPVHTLSSQKYWSLPFLPLLIVSAYHPTANRLTLPFSLGAVAFG
jgi:hypothetical protein